MWRRSSDRRSADDNPARRPFRPGENQEGAASRPAPSPAAPSSPAAAPGGEPRRSRGSSVLSAALRVDGEVFGEEDLTIHGSLEGRVRLPGYVVMVGAEGRVTGDLHGRVVDVEGRVDGDLYGSEQVRVRASGRVTGKIQAPRVVVEDGASFQGSIDMSKPKTSAPPSPEVSEAPKAERPEPAPGPERAGESPGAAGDGKDDSVESRAAENRAMAAQAVEARRSGSSPEQTELPGSGGEAGDGRADISDRDAGGGRKKGRRNRG